MLTLNVDTDPALRQTQCEAERLMSMFPNKQWSLGG